MRLVSLSDGRVCYLSPVQSKRDLPEGEVVARASIRGLLPFGILLPTGWPAAHESDLRRHIEHALATAPPGAEPTAPAPLVTAPKPRRSGGFLSALLGRSATPG